MSGSSQVSDYLAKKEQVKEVFVSKDELFGQVDLMFRRILNRKGEYLKRARGHNTTILDKWHQKEQEIKNIQGEIR
jgi:hypothetical protein